MAGKANRIDDLEPDELARREAFTREVAEVCKKYHLPNFVIATRDDQTFSIELGGKAGDGIDWARRFAQSLEVLIEGGVLCEECGGVHGLPRERKQ